MSSGRRFLLTRCCQQACGTVSITGSPEGPAAQMETAMRQTLPLAWFLTAITLLALAPSGWAANANRDASALAFATVTSLRIG